MTDKPKFKTKEEQELYDKLSVKKYRMNNLFRVVNEQGRDVLFEMKPEQEELLIDRLWYCNIVLKARQLGISTAIELYGLDACLIDDNTSFGIIDATLPDAKQKLAKCKYAYERLPDWFKKERRLIKDNEQELEFSNGSRITADTSFRGSTLNILHISEYAKICATDPIKAEEIKTGALNTIAPGQIVFIEGTAKDAVGEFYEMVKRARELHEAKVKLTKLDYRFYFFPWFRENRYRLTPPSNFVFPQESDQYFRKLEEMGIHLDLDQKYWYFKKSEEQQDSMKSEYPSTPDEAFEVAQESKYYSTELQRVKRENRITEFDIDPLVPVDLYFDLGRSDYTSVIFSQNVGKEVRIVDFLEESDVHITDILRLILLKKYEIGYVYLPHDAVAQVLSAEKSTYQYCLEVFGSQKIRTVDKLGLDMGISEVRKLFPRLWFRKSTTGLLIEHLSEYRKKFSRVIRVFTGEVHDEHSHAAAALRYLAVAYKDGSSSFVGGISKSKIRKKGKSFKGGYRPLGGVYNNR